MSVVGVDFGLANSVIAAAGRGGVDVILNVSECSVWFGIGSWRSIRYVASGRISTWKMGIFD